MTWLLLLFFHVCGLVGFNLTLRRSLLKKADPFTLATIMQTGIAIPAVFLLILKPMTFSGYQPMYVLGFATSALLTISLQVSNTKALEYLEASVYPMLYNLRILITTVLGILFLSEDFIGFRVAGGLLILLAIFIVRQKGSRSITSKGVQWGVIAAFVVSLLNMNEKIMVTHINFFDYFPLLSIVAAVLMWLYMLCRRKKFDRSMFMRPQTAELMVLRSISAYGFTGALAAGALISVANYISAMSVIVMVVLGVLLLSERDYLLRKVVATTVAVIGLTIVLFTHLL
jgi:drug/metabolite transporter (DMT)-like permease